MLLCALFFVVMWSVRRPFGKCGLFVVVYCLLLYIVCCCVLMIFVVFCFCLVGLESDSATPTLPPTSPNVPWRWWADSRFARLLILVDVVVHAVFCCCFVGREAFWEVRVHDADVAAHVAQCALAGTRVAGRIVRNQHGRRSVCTTLDAWRV